MRDRAKSDKAIRTWLANLQLPEFSEEQVETAYKAWVRAHLAWDRQLGCGSTYTMRAILWYQNVYLHSRAHEWRTKVILRHIRRHLEGKGLL